MAGAAHNPCTTSLTQTGAGAIIGALDQALPSSSPGQGGQVGAGAVDFFWSRND